MNRHNGAWSDEREEQLRGLWAEGLLSCSQIAARIGGTRNSIIGKVHRLGLAGRAPVPPPKRRASKQRPMRMTTSRFLMAAGCHPRPYADDPTIAQSAPLVLPPPDPCCATPLLDLAPHGCRWPAGEGTLEAPYLFCGAIAVEGSSYCRFHRDFSVNKSWNGNGWRRPDVVARYSSPTLRGLPPTIEEL